MLYTKLPVRLTDAEMLRRFYGLYLVLNHWPTHADLEANFKFLGATARSYTGRFGGIKPLIAATKLTFNLLSEEAMEIILPEQQYILQRLAKLHGSILYWQGASFYVKDKRIASLRDFSRYCGGLDAALRTVGLPVCFPTRDDLIEALQLAYAYLGHAPRMSECEGKLCTYPLSAYLNEFTTWNAALKAADIPLNLDQPNRRLIYAQRKYSFYRHPNQDYCNHPAPIPPKPLQKAEDIPSLTI